jgi:membrane protease YdiL (CAAX protease family)
MSTNHAHFTGDLRSSRGTFEPMIAVAALALAAWPILLSQFRHGDVYAWLGPFAIAVIALILLTSRGRDFVVRDHLVRDALIGLGVGVVMTIGTYVAYAVAVHVVPTLPAHVAGLYAASRTERPWLAIVWTVVILAAEETLWRGPVFALTEKKWGTRLAVIVSLATYAAAQAGSGSVVVVLAAVICGGIWSAERALTKSFVAPLCSHLVWTPIVIHLFPVTSLHLG